MATSPFHGTTSYPGSTTSTEEGSAWARALAEQAGLSEERAYALDLHRRDGEQHVDHSYRGRRGDRLELALGRLGHPHDRDEGRVRPLSVPAPVAPASLDDAAIGGYGIHMVRSSADACEYKWSEGRNVFTAYFGLPVTPA